MHQGLLFMCGNIFEIKINRPQEIPEKHECNNMEKSSTKIYLNNSMAITNVSMILKVCAIRNAYNGFLLLCTNSSLKFVSRPIDVKASANHKPCILFNSALTLLICSALITKENSKDAKTKPRTISENAPK